MTEKTPDLQTILDNFSEGFCRWTPTLRIVKVNAAFLRLLGLPAAFRDAAPKDAPPPVFRELAEAVMYGLGQRERMSNREIRLKLGSSGVSWLNVNGGRLADEQGNLCYEAWISDISRLKLKEAELSHRMYYDEVTGLANRDFFADSLMQAIRRCGEQPDVRYAVLCLDLRNFKNINRHYGRDFGNVLLRYTATTLISCCREADTIARTANDEFCVLLHGPETGAQLIKIIKRIRARLDQPFNAWGQDIYAVKADIGVIFPLNDYNRAESALRDLDIAVTKAKGMRDTTGCKFFSKKMLKETRKRFSLSIILQEMHDLKEFFLVYQPIVRPTDGALHGFEALARWRRNGEDIAPDTFIPIAEETGFIRRLGAYILEEACHQLRDWQQQFGRDIDLHVNISPYQLFMPNFPDTVTDILHHSDVDASRLILEVTESVFQRDFDKVLHNIRTLREGGIRFCLDDFGTGYSSLSYLRQLPIECLKIDRSFVCCLEKDDKSRVLLRHILALAGDMGYSVVVEGVERKTQLELLGDLGDLLIQGYCFYKPLSVGDAETLLGRRQL
ncbi:MAG: EAL domain-containing protein [Desulfovibrio sp.]|jgi:diguanylate cyclase (GGDEF)-like protein|nr:EAL domain-containing protein [Desulfovibrio sp.]